MAERILKLQFMGKCVNLVIPDIDKCQLIDVLKDMCEEYGEKGYELPTYPVLQYCYRECSHQLTDDKALMKMFEVLSSKTIDIWIGCLQEPNLIWTLAEKVRNQPQTSASRLEKLPIYKLKQPSQPLVEVVNNLPLSPILSLRRSQPTTSIQLSCSHSQQPTTSIQLSCIDQKKKRGPLRQSSFPHGKKIPKTTAVNRGIWDVKKNDSQTQPPPQQGVGLRKKNKVKGVQHADIIGSSSSSDSEYQPDHNTDVESEENYDIDFEEGDINELLNHNFVDCSWEPFRTNEFVAGECGYLSKLYKNGEVYDDVPHGQINLKEWQLFVDKDHLKDTLRDFCIQEGFSLVVERADNTRYTAICVDVRCDWKIHAAVLGDGYTWAIKSLKKTHCCDLNLVNNPMCNCDWAAKKLIEDIRADPNIRGHTINELLWSRYGLRMATSTLYRMKAIAMKMIQGRHDESYTHLPEYCEILKDANPGSVAFCTWRTLQSPQKALQFTGIFISFSAQFKGLINGCRGLVGVDGCHLKGNYGGILLSVVSLDGNNEIFPVAVAVVDSENKVSWSWFFSQMKNLLTEGGREDWTIMSDRQKGIDPSLDVVWPTVDRRYCARHLCKNFKIEYPGLLMHKLFWGVTNAYSAYSFRKALIQVQRNAGLGAVKWFRDVGPLDRWTRWKYDPMLCSDENTNNFVESFNSTIGIDRTYPILTLLEGVRRIAMVRHAARQSLAENWPDVGVCPNIVQQVRALTKDSRFCQAYPSSRGTYEIHDGTAKLPVPLTSFTCACSRWQISGIPCKHAIKAILHEGKDPLTFVSSWFSVARYKEAYNGNITPVPDQDQWPHNSCHPTLIPPIMKRSVGKPSRNRRREEGEQAKGKRSKTVTCSNCKGFGHNVNTCKGGNTAREIAEQQGKMGKQPYRGKKARKQNMNNDEFDFSLVEMMIAGNAKQHVDITDVGHASQASQPSQPTVEPSNSRGKQGKQRKKSNHSLNNNLIDNMLSSSQPPMQPVYTDIASQPQLMSLPSTSTTNVPDS